MNNSSKSGQLNSPGGLYFNSYCPSGSVSWICREPETKVFDLLIILIVRFSLPVHLLRPVWQLVTSLVIRLGRRTVRHPGWES